MSKSHSFIKITFITLATLWVIGCLTIAGFIGYSWYQRNNQLPVSNQNPPTVSQLFTEVNSQRVKAGLTPLKEDTRLNKSSKTHCTDMLAANVYSHNMPDGRTPLEYILADWGETTGFIWGENNSYGWTSTYDVVQGWMNSPDHRENILDEDYVAVGYGVCKATNYTAPGLPVTDGYLVVQQFVGV